MPNQVLARIRANLRRLSDRTGATVTSDSLTIDFGARQVTAYGHKIRLTPKEFDLLHYLLSNANKPVTHRKLLQTYGGRTTAMK
jgi:DNA-binding response OmpR family regulator